MKWIGYSNNVSVNVLFTTAILLWYIPFTGSKELVYWYAYNEINRDNLVRRYRRILPIGFIHVYLASKIEFRKLLFDSREEL